MIHQRFANLVDSPRGNRIRNVSRPRNLVYRPSSGGRVPQAVSRPAVTLSTAYVPQAVSRPFFCAFFNSVIQKSADSFYFLILPEIRGFCAETGVVRFVFLILIEMSAFRLSFCPSGQKSAHSEHAVRGFCARIKKKSARALICCAELKSKVMTAYYLELR